MRFLVDANVSPRVAELLRAGGHDAVAVREIGLQHSSDDALLDRAVADERIVVSHDTDFGTLLAIRRTNQPSCILVRSADPLTAEQLAGLLLHNLDVMADDLNNGAIVTLARGHLRSRRLPLR